MTREEAIAKLKEKRQIFIDEWADLDDIVEAFDIAITALSANRPTDWTPLRFEDEYKMTSDFPWELDGSWVIVTDGQSVSVERIKKDAYDHFFPNGRWFELEDVIAWMPLPKRINNTTESANDVVEKNDEVIETVRCKDCKWFKNCEYFKKPPCRHKEPSDLISRADAIEAIQNAYCKPCKERGDDHNEVRCRACAFDDAIIQIDALPSADAVDVNDVTIHYKPYPSADAVQGEWIMHIDDLFPCESTQECSVCHAEQPISISDDNYCPSCGARMENKE